MALEFDMRFDPRHGEAVEVAEDILRITAPNASPFTFHGTNSYVVGRRELAVIEEKDISPERKSFLDKVKKMFSK